MEAVTMPDAVGLPLPLSPQGEGARRAGEGLERLGARHGGTLFPVLIMASMLLVLCTMVPQVLVSASNAMRTDRQRDDLLYAAESGVAMAEARLKRRVMDDVLANAPTTTPAWTIFPTIDNPDYGKRKRYDFEVKVVDLKFKDRAILAPNQELQRFEYKLDAKAWDSQSERKLRLGVNGMIALRVAVDPGQSGVILRSVQDVMIQAINRESKD